MPTDPLERHLGQTGFDPTPAFQAGLEATLSRAYDGEPVSSDGQHQNRGRGSLRRITLVAVAAAVVVAFVGAVVLRDDPERKSIVDAPVPDTVGVTLLPTTLVPTTLPATTLPATTLPATTLPATTLPATTLPATTLPTSVAAIETTTIDLTSTAPPLEPTLVASYPIAPPGDLFPTAYATPAGGNRIAVLDDVTGTVRFIDATTGAELSSYPTAVPTIGSPSFIAGGFFIGPDDVVYTVEGGPGLPAVVAYGLRDGSYVEVARVPYAPLDVTIVLGGTGIAFVDGTPVLSYVDHDGQPSGASLDVKPISVIADSATNTYRIERDGRTWTVGYVYSPDVGGPEANDVCQLCINAFPGPDGSIILDDRAPKPDGDLQIKITVLSDQTLTYDTDWNYAGALDGKLLFTRLDQESIYIATFAP